MHKKLAATLTIAIFLLSTLAIVAPAYAHFTLGDLTPTYRYHANDFDPHVAGVIGYVWPGGGTNAYQGFTTAGWAMDNGHPPGYQSPYPGGKPFGAPANALQLEGDEYAPYGAVLAGSTGDLVFAVNATAGFGNGGADFTTLNILIPPEFAIQDESQVVTTITNNGENIRIYHLGPLDRFAPGWTLVKIYSDSGAGGIGGTVNDETFGDITFTTRAEWYYVRVNGVTAPTLAGRYFFKMYLTGDQLNPAGFATGNYWVPVENWPVMLVKGELDPAIITGTIRYAGYNSTLYGQGIGEAGKVWAHMTSKLDPYTGATVVATCPTTSDYTIGCTDAVGYFNATARGHYEVEGVAPGVYDLYAQAAGYPQALIATGVTVLKGQSLHFDGYLQPGVVIHGNVFTKHQFGEEPWPNTEYIKIELYSNPTNNHIPDASAGTPVVWSPLPCVVGGQDLYSPGYDAARCGDPRNGGQVAFPWHEYTNGNGYSNTNPFGGAGFTLSADYQGITGAENNLLRYPDPQGVGPAQNWFVNGGTTDPFHFEMGAKGEYGAPQEYDGHVPQIFATWTNGLTPGRYYVRAWAFRYVQAALDGSTFQEYSFDVTPQEWAGDVTLPIDLRLSSWVNKTVHFHNMPGTLTTDGINTGANWLTGGLWDANGNMFAWNSTYLPLPAQVKGATYPDHTWIDGANINEFCNTPGRPEYGSCNIQFWGINDTWVGQNYGIPSGTYQPKVYALGYLQQTTDYVSVTLSGTPTSISDHLYRGVGFNFTVYSIDWERPRVNRNWLYQDSDIEVAILDAQGNFMSEVCDGCDGASGFYDPYAGGGMPRTVDGSYGITQYFDEYSVQADGGGRNVLPTDNAQQAFFGLECSYCLVGGYWSRTGGAHTGFTTKNSWSAWKATFYTPSAFDSGQYSFRGWTYGYIQNKDYSVYALKGQVADIKINLIIGVNVTVDILFKKEHIITPTNANMQARVRLFNDQGQLVAEWMTSEGTFITASGRAAAADNPWGTDTQPYDFFDGYNYLPGGVSLLHVELHGLPAYYGSFGDNIFTAYHGDFEVDMWGDVTHFPNAGILGYPDYQGGWTAEVDFVNLYNNNTALTALTPGSFAFGTVTDPNMVNNWYPPVAGLLMGESFHIIPGTTATSGISFTEDGALDSFNVGHSMAPNHLGPYAQQGVWQLSNAHNSGEASGIFEVDLNGYITGQALAFTWSTEFRTLSWYTAQVVSADGKQTFNFYTSDGIYEGFLTPGTYQLTLAGPGLASQTLSLAVSAGMSSAPGSGANLYLEQSNVPVPEFSGLAIAAFSALAASLYVLRRRRK